MLLFWSKKKKKKKGVGETTLLPVLKGIFVLSQGRGDYCTETGPKSTRNPVNGPVNCITYPQEKQGRAFILLKPMKMVVQTTVIMQQQT